MSAPTVHVFVSSTWLDLQPERKAVEAALQRMRETKLIGMEYFGSRDDTTRAVSLAEVDRSHFYVGIFGARYGSGITEAEYRRAREKGIPCHIYFKAEATIDDDHREKDAVESAKLTALKEGLKREHIVAEFTNPDNLATIITADFHNWFVETNRAERHEPGNLHQLPPRPEGFVGRESDLAKLRALNPASGAVLTGLRGMGGIGKTALALVLAHEWAPRFPEAQLFLDARGTQVDPPSARRLMERVIQTFDTTAMLPDDEAAVKTIYYYVLGGKKALILLDNARDAAQATPLIPPAGCAFIVTSRQTFLLGTARPCNVDRLPDDEAVKLLRKFHAGLSDTESAALVQICAGLPLALRLAGTHLALDAAERGGVPNVAVYLKALTGGRLKTLNTEAADVDEITISETLRLSETQLPVVEREAWRRLGVFTASFDMRAAAVIAGAEEEMLGRCVRRSLLEREGGDRYKLHDLVADYAREQFGDDVLAELRLAHARHYVEIAAEAEQAYMAGGTGVIRGLKIFDRERSHLEGAFEWLRTRPDRESVETLVTLVGAIPWTSVMRFHPRKSIEWQQARLNSARTIGNQNQECWSLSDLGIAYRHLGEARKAVDCHREQEKIATRIDDQLGVCNALNNLGLAYADLGDARKAIACYEKARPIASGLSDRRWAGYSLNNLGLAYADLGDVGKAIEFYDQALAIARDIGDWRGEGNALGNLGLSHANLGDARKAIEFYEQQLVIVREIGDRRGEGRALGNLGLTYAGLGDARKAIEFYEQQLVIVREIGDRRGEGNALFNSALANDSLENRAEAIARATAALAIYEAIEDPDAATAREWLARWKQEAGGSRSD